MLKRPFRLGLSAWIVIGIGIANGVQSFVFGGLSRELAAPAGVPLWYIYLGSVLVPVLFVLCGLGLLAAREWARILWVVLWMLFFTDQAFHPPISMPRIGAALGVLAVWVWVLFHPYVNDYFVAVASQRDADLLG